MTYQVLARKWRPRRFTELVGQQHVVKALDNALAAGRLHHAYLFTGTRGVGKTTIARILAKGLNCERGVTAEPCGVCSACVELDEGRFVDLIEVDAASRARVDETRELMDNVQYAPARGRYKVYLIDEVHMFSKHSFNALLKTLEEPPPHVKFLLATTDPQRLPITVLSRCLQFHLRQLPDSEITGHLTHLVQSEGVEAEHAALRLLARGARGSMRDALSLLDQAVAYGAGSVSEQDVRDMLGVVDAEGVWTLLERLADGDGKVLLETVEQLASAAPDFDAMLTELLQALQIVAVHQTVPDADVPEDAPDDRVRVLANRVSAEDIQLWYQIGVMGRRDLPFAVSAKSGVEMTVLRMLAFTPNNTAPSGGAGGTGASGADSKSSNANGLRSSQPSTQSPRTSRSLEKTSVGVATSQVPDASTSATSQSAFSGDVDMPRPESPAARAAAVLKRAGQASAPRHTESDEQVAADSFDFESRAASATASELNLKERINDASQLSDSASRAPLVEQERESVSDVSPREAPQTLAFEVESSDWNQVATGLELQGLSRELAFNCELGAIDKSRIVFRISPAQAQLCGPRAQQTLTDALRARYPELKAVDFEVAERSTESPAEVRVRRDKERREAAAQDLRQDPNVAHLASMFGAQVDPDKVRPTGDGAS